MTVLNEVSGGKIWDAKHIPVPPLPQTGVQSCLVKASWSSNMV